MAKKYNVNDLFDEKDIIQKIIYQINSVNTKIKKFENEGIEEHLQFVKELLGDDTVNFHSNNTISKSKKQFVGKNILSLKRTLSALKEVNNNEVYGTVRKYNNQLHDNIKRLKKYCMKSLLDKGYSEEYAKQIVNKPSFYENVIYAFNTYQDVTSDQIIDALVKMHEEDMSITKEQAKKYVTSIEFSEKMTNKIKEQQDEYLEMVEFMKNSKNRNKSRR